MCRNSSFSALKWTVVTGAVILAVGVALWAVARERSQSGTTQGDFDGNGAVDTGDLFDFAYYYGLERGERLYEEEGYRADFDQSGRVDEVDLFQFRLMVEKRQATDN